MNSREVTLHNSQDSVLKAIRNLYLPKGPYLDPTYSKGLIYKSGAMPYPVHRSDLVPQYPSVTQTDCRNLSFNKGSVPSIMFDPPFTVAAGKKSIIGNRFSSPETILELHAFYSAAVKEFHRVLERGGILVVKIMDTVSSGKQHRNTFRIWDCATYYGLIDQDWLICPNKSTLVGHNWGRQVHAQKTHVNWLVFQKAPKRKNQVLPELLPDLP